MTGEAKETREARLAAALRENLRRRKAQARGKAGAVPEPAAPEAVKGFVNHSPDQSDDIPGDAPVQGEAPDQGGPAAR